MTREPISQKKSFWITLQVAVMIFSIIGGIYLIRSEVRSEVKRITTSDKFIDNLTSQISPYIIIDSNGSYLFDGGALKYVENTEVINGIHPWFDDKTIAPTKIVIQTDRVLPFAPQISCLDGESEELIHVKRGKNTTWIFDLSNWLSNDPGGIDTFRIDLTAP